jgi:hypothetical protein
MGTVESRDPDVIMHENIGTSGQYGTYKTYKNRTPCQAKFGLSIRERTAR